MWFLLKLNLALITYYCRRGRSLSSKDLGTRVQGEVSLLNRHNQFNSQTCNRLATQTSSTTTIVMRELHISQTTKTTMTSWTGRTRTSDKPIRITWCIQDNIKCPTCVSCGGRIEKKRTHRRSKSQSVHHLVFFFRYDLTKVLWWVPPFIRNNRPPMVLAFKLCLYPTFIAQHISFTVL